MAAEAPVRSLFITLRRSLAGVRDSHSRTLESLGLRRREKTYERGNTASVRGAVAKVKHLVSVETDAARAARLAAEAAAAAPRPPVRVRHDL
jgi:large subunit ribosomal protein L30